MTALNAKLLCELGQPILVGFEHFVDHGADLTQGADGRGQRIVADCLIDHFLVAGEAAFDGQLFDLSRGAAEQRQLRGHLAGVDGLEAAGAGQNRNFDAAAFGQIIDQAEVADVAVELVQLAIAEYGIEDGSSVFVAALKVEGFFEPLDDFVLPGVLALAVLVEDVSILAGIPAGAGQTVLSMRSGRLRNQALYSLL